MRSAGFSGLIAAAIAIFLYAKSSNAQDAQNSIVAGDPVFDVPPVNVSEMDLKMNITQLSDDGLNALKLREGFSHVPFSDFKGFSIAYGHLIKPGENLTYVTESQGLELLATDVAWACAAVAKNVSVPITQNEFDALVSFVYNVGESAFTKSTMLKKINASDPTASGEFGKWVYAGGSVNAGLVARRETEANQFLS